MACNCFEKTAALFKERISEKVGDALGEIEEAGFENSLYNFSGGDHSPVAMNFKFRYYRKRKDGGLAANQTKADHLCMMSYCPLCGTKFEGDELRGGCQMKERPYDNRKARIEKKFSTEAMRLLIALMPRQYPADAFEMELGYECRLDFDQWQVTTVDYWGEADSYDAFYLLHDALILQTTDWDGIGKAHDAAGWENHDSVDESPFYSPWRLGDVTRREIITHCRKLVKAGVCWEVERG